MKRYQKLPNIYAIKKKLCVCVFVYKRFEISKKAYKKCEIEIINDGKYFWVKRRDLEKESDYDNWPQIFDKCAPEKEKYRYQLMCNTEFQPRRKFLRNDLVEKKILSCSKASEKSLKFKKS